jgi:hypothetical protein
MKIKKIIILLVSILAIYLAFNIFYFYQKKEAKVEVPIHALRINYTLEDCKKVNFEIGEITCENGVIKASIFNSGNIELIGDFLGIIYTPNLQAMIGTSPKEPIKINQTSILAFDFGKGDLINRVEIVFQPCPFSTKVIENLNIKC